MSLTNAQIRAIINEIENKYPVETWVMNDIHVWPLVRIQLSFELFYAGRNDSSNTIKKSGIIAALTPLKRVFKSIFAFCKAYITDLEHNASSDNLVDCLFLSYTIHRTLLSNKWFDKFCDPYVDALSALGLKSLVLEMSAKEEYRIPRYRQSKFIQPALEGVLIRSKCRGKRVSWHEELTGFAEMIESLKKINPEISMPAPENLRVKVVELIDLKAYFKRILAKVRPSIVFIAEYYSLCGMALILACRECGIRTVDIQHGVQGDDHAAYGFWTKVPASGYEMLPSVFWCWSDYEAGVLNKWNPDFQQIHRAFVGGNLWLDLWREEHSELVEYYDNILDRLKSMTGRVTHVLLTPSQLADMKEWIFTAMQASSAECFWWVRVHPSRFEQRDIVRDMLIKHGLNNVNLDHATDLPLQALLRHVDINVTASSSTVLDAECYGIPSVLTDISEITLFPEQIASGLVTTAFNAEELLDVIKGQTEKMGKAKHVLKTAPSNREVVKKFLLTCDEAVSI